MGEVEEVKKLKAGNYICKVSANDGHFTNRFLVI